MLTISQCVEKIFNLYPDINLYTFKQEGKSLDGFCYNLPEDERREITVDLLESIIAQYYPLPDKFRLRLTCLDTMTLDSLLVWVREKQIRKVLDYLLSPDEMLEISLGYAYRMEEIQNKNWKTTSSFCFAEEKILDYSTTSMAYAMIRIAKTKEEKVIAKNMFLRGLEEQLALQFIFIPVRSVADEVLLIRQPSTLTGIDILELTCPITERKIRLEIPDCYYFTEKGKAKLGRLLAADLALSNILWIWLRCGYVENYTTLVACLNWDDCLKLCHLQHCIDLFLIPIHPLIREKCGDVLLGRYLQLLGNNEGRSVIYNHRILTALYYADRFGISNLMAEACTITGEVHLDQFKERLTLYVKNSPHLQKVALAKLAEI